MNAEDRYRTLLSIEVGLNAWEDRHFLHVQNLLIASIQEEGEQYVTT